MTKNLEIDVSDLITQMQAAELRETSQAAISDLMKRKRLRIYTIAGKKFLSRREVLAFEGQQGRKILTKGNK